MQDEPHPRFGAGKRALITGAGRGLGRAMALELARAGWSVLLVARSKSQLQSVQREIHEVGGQAEILPADLLEEQAVGKFDSVFESGIQLLINNAAMIRVENFEDISESHWSEQITLNLTRPFQLMQKFIKQRNLKEGVILNIASLAGIESEEKFPGFAAYSASKSALVSLSLSLAAELKGRSVACHCLAPGAIQTQMLKEALPDFSTQTQADDVARAAIDLVQQSFLSKDFTSRLVKLENL